MWSHPNKRMEMVDLVCQEGRMCVGWRVRGPNCSARRIRVGEHALTSALTHHLVPRVTGWIRPPSNISLAFVMHFHWHTSEQVLKVSEWITTLCMTPALSLSHKKTYKHTHQRTHTYNKKYFSVECTLEHWFPPLLYLAGWSLDNQVVFLQ